MKKIISIVLFCLGRFIAIIFPYSLSELFQFFRNKVYTNWITSGFKKYAKTSLFIYPMIMKGGKYISVGERVYIGTRGVLTAWDSYENDLFEPQIIIGNNVRIGDDCHITAINKIEIGNGVLMGKKVTITDNSHGKTDYALLSIPPVKRPLYSKGPVIIENGVWIGDKATILSGVKIGKNSIIAANAVVTTDIPDNCVAGGIPAKVIKKMEKEI